MDISDNEDFALFEDLFTDFAQNELLPNREENDHFPFNDYPDVLVEKALELGLFDIILPEELGGAGQNMQVFCRLLTILSETDASMAAMLFTHALSQNLLRGAEQGKRIKAIASSVKADTRLPIFAFPAFDNPAQTPPQLQAHKNGAEYFLTGNVKYLSMGHKAAFALVPALVKDDEFSWFLVGLANMPAPEPILGLGLNMCPAVDLEFDDIKAELIGAVGAGAKLSQELIDGMIIAAAAMSLGVMKGSLKEAAEYSFQRTQGGRLIHKWTAVQAILANMMVLTRTAEMALEQVSIAQDKQAPGWQTSVRSVSVFIQEQACHVTTDGIQVLGGYGYMKDYGQEKRFRDATHLQSLLGLCGVKKLTCFESLIQELSGAA